MSFNVLIGGEVLLFRKITLLNGYAAEYLDGSPVNRAHRSGICITKEETVGHIQQCRSQARTSSSYFFN